MWHEEVVAGPQPAKTASCQIQQSENDHLTSALASERISKLGEPPTEASERVICVQVLLLLKYLLLVTIVKNPESQVPLKYNVSLSLVGNWAGRGNKRVLHFSYQ
jgi:hypothetical protein